MDNTREKLIELLSKTSCRGDGESLGSCPDRKYGMCGEVANLSYCVIQNIANHLICNGVTLQDHDCCWATEIAYKNGYEAGKPKWIPVTERLPEDDETVLILCKTGKMFVGYRKQLYGGEYVWRILTARDSTKKITQIVTHWMPLPEPPKED